MFGRFLPREMSFFDLFERHAALTVSGCREMLAVASGEAGNLAAKVTRIKEIEHETDVITHQCVEALHKTFITPIERDDIYRLIGRMDDVMDLVYAAADRLALYDVREMRPELRELTQVLVTATQEIELALRGLRDMKNADEVVKHCIDVNRLENEADVIFRTALARLFREEKDAITILKWKEILEQLELATDRCEDVANIIEGVILEHA